VTENKTQKEFGKEKFELTKNFQALGGYQSLWTTGEKTSFSLVTVKS
jgi:hypothetical protein